MKKNILVLLIFVLIILCTGCGNKTITIEDKSLGYSSSFTYKSNLGFKLKDVVKGDNDSSDSVTFINRRLNINAIAYYVEMDKENYEIAKNMKKQNSKFSEFNFNGYDSYGYLSHDNLAQMYIKLDEKDGNVITLYVYIEKIRERDNTDLFEVLNSDKMNKFLSSIKVSNI